MTALDEQQLLKTELEQEEEDSIDFLEMFYRVIEKMRYILASGLLVALVVGLIVFFAVTPIYEATSKLYVVNGNNSVVDLSAFQMGNYMVADYQEVFSNWELHQQVIDELGLKYDYEKLNKMVKVSNPADTRVLYITVSSDDAQEAMDMANTYAQLSQKFIKEAMDSKAPTLFEAARLPEKPASPKKAVSVIIGFVAGALICLAIVIIQFMMDDRINSSEYVEKHLGMPTLGMMPLEGQQGLDAATKKKRKD